MLLCASPLCNVCSTSPQGPQEYLLLCTKENGSFSPLDYQSIKGPHIINEFALPSRRLLMTAQFASDVFILAAATSGRRRCSEQCRRFVPFRHGTVVVTPHTSQWRGKGQWEGCALTDKRKSPAVLRESRRCGRAYSCLLGQPPPPQQVRSPQAQTGLLPCRNSYSEEMLHEASYLF